MIVETYPAMATELVMELADFLSIILDIDNFRGNPQKDETEAVCDRLEEHPFLTNQMGGDFVLSVRDAQRPAPQSATGNGYLRRGDMQQAPERAIVNGYLRTVQQTQPGRAASQQRDTEVVVLLGSNGKKSSVI